MSDFVTPSAVARALGVSVRAVSGWCASGAVEGAKKTPGKRGRWRLPRAFLDDYLRSQSEGSEATT